MIKMITPTSRRPSALGQSRHWHERRIRIVKLSKICAFTLLPLRGGACCLLLAAAFTNHWFFSSSRFSVGHCRFSCLLLAAGCLRQLPVLGREPKAASSLLPSLTTGHWPLTTVLTHWPLTTALTRFVNLLGQIVQGPEMIMKTFEVYAGGNFEGLQLSGALEVVEDQAATDHAALIGLPFRSFRPGIGYLSPALSG